MVLTLGSVLIDDTTTEMISSEGILLKATGNFRSFEETSPVARVSLIAEGVILKDSKQQNQVHI